MNHISDQKLDLMWTCMHAHACACINLNFRPKSGCHVNTSIYKNLNEFNNVSAFSILILSDYFHVITLNFFCTGINWSIYSSHKSAYEYIMNTSTTRKYMYAFKEIYTNSSVVNFIMNTNPLDQKHHPPQFVYFLPQLTICPHQLFFLG